MWRAILLSFFFLTLAGAPKGQGTSRAAKPTRSVRNDAQDLYHMPLYDKQDFLHQLDRRQFNNTVIQAMDNTDLTVSWIAIQFATATPKSCDHQSPFFFSPFFFRGGGGGGGRGGGGWFRDFSVFSFFFGGGRGLEFQRFIRLRFFSIL